MGLFTTIKEMLNPPKVDYAIVLTRGGVVVDVRSKDEFRQGHAKGSQNIPLHVLSNKVTSLQGKEVILVCRSGARAGQARSILKQHGITAHNAGPWQNLKNVKK